MLMHPIYLISTKEDLWIGTFVATNACRKIYSKTLQNKISVLKWIYKQYNEIYEENQVKDKQILHLNSAKNSESEVIPTIL